MECDLEQLRNDTSAIRASLEHAEAIEAALTSQVGAARAVSLDNLRSTLGEMHAILSEHLSRRDVSPAQNGGAEELGVAADGSTAPADRRGGDIRSREDVVHALEKICQYYARNEPSSPLPLLLNRAKRLASKSFLEIVQDLTPDAVGQIQALGGVDASKSEE
jgi:type VI secretion system protein ImpA